MEMLGAESFKEHMMLLQGLFRFSFTGQDAGLE
jgi:hypothetical protein